MDHSDLKRHWKDIAVSLLKVGATTYGGPAIMGIMQAELQKRRQWLSKAHARWLRARRAAEPLVIPARAAVGALGWSRHSALT
jgi:hypothetical protein